MDFKNWFRLPRIYHLLHIHRLFIILSLSLFAAPCLADQNYKDRPWNKDLIYFVLTDRFLDGDLTNNIPAGSDAKLYDSNQKNINLYHGGDLRGLELALQDGYFSKLGVTAIWVTPPVANAWFSQVEDKSGYHGYWAQNFLDIDKHLVSRQSMSGALYPDNRDGRMAHYRDFIKLAHKKNIKIIQDVVMNHVGPLFYYDQDGDGQLDQYKHDGSDLRDYFKDKAYDDWLQPYKKEGFYSNSAWHEIPKWNIGKSLPEANEVIFGKTLPTSGVLQSLVTYGRKGFTWAPNSLGKSDGEEVSCDFFALRDIWTGAEAPFFDELVDEFVTIYHFYINVLGVDGLRIDTVKHVHHRFWDAFTSRLRDKLGTEAAKRIILFGEVYDFNPEPVGKYTFRTDYPNKTDPSLDSLLNFPFCGAVRQYLRVKGDHIGKSNNLKQMIDNFYNNNPRTKPYLNPTPGMDGLIARQKMINFIGNHDGLNRFLVNEVNKENNRLALGLAMTMEGIPCIYYGSESAMRTTGEINEESESGRETYCLLISHGMEKLKTAREEKTFKTISSIARHRIDHPALTDGKINVVWNDQKNSSDDDKGIFAFVRYLEEDGVIDKMATVLVVVNSSTSQGVTAVADNNFLHLISREGKPVVPKNCSLRPLLIEGQDIMGSSSQKFLTEMDPSGSPQIKVTASPKTINIYVVDL